MSTLLQDIKTQSNWIIRAFAEDKLKLDYSIHSFINIDIFFNKHSNNGKAIKGGRLSKNFGAIIFSIGSYVGETIIKNIPGSDWQTNEQNPEDEFNVSIQLPNGTTIYPIQRIMKRFQNGTDDAIYVYGYHICKDHITEPFDQAFWQAISQNKEKKWWQFW